MVNRQPGGGIIKRERRLLYSLSAQARRDLEDLHSLELVVLVLCDLLKLLRVRSVQSCQPLLFGRMLWESARLTSIIRSTRAMSPTISRARSCWRESGPLDARRRGMECEVRSERRRVMRSMIGPLAGGVVMLGTEQEVFAVGGWRSKRRHPTHTLTCRDERPFSLGDRSIDSQASISIQYSQST
jgi:hypothetical protein